MAVLQQTANKDINRTNKRTLRVLYRDYDSSFDQLLARAGSIIVHRKEPTKSND